MVKNLTLGSPRRLIINFAIPLLIGNLFQQLYNIADTLIVGQTLGVKALAGVGSTAGIMFLIIGFMQGLTAGLAIPLGRAFGAGDAAGVRRSFAIAVWVSATVALMVSASGALLAPQILKVMQTPADIMQDATAYLTVILAGSAAVTFYNLLANTLRALGDSRTPLYFLIIAAVLNILLDLLFIVGFGWGVAGAGWATVISQLLAAILCCVYLWQTVEQLHLSAEDFRPVSGELHEHLRMSLPMAFQFSVIALGTLLIQYSLNLLGSTSVAAYSVAQKIESLTMFPLVSFGVAVGFFTAQNMGAGLHDRVRLGVRQTAVISIIFGCTVGVFIIAAMPLLVAAFLGAGHGEVTELARLYFLVSVPLYPALSLLFIYRFALQALGNAFIPTLAGFLELAARLLTVLLIVPAFGYTGVVVANPMAWIFALIPLAFTYRRSFIKEAETG
ncbi:MAG: MATE family efflux transporter [Rothia sp. (in: high G+C Gram-positive bacteria)]|nr:MATE family efflux transporter [Rothia sp. (in: high G+C Gram-positive bacteria)]